MKTEEVNPKVVVVSSETGRTHYVTERPCKNCNEPFIGETGAQRYCSHYCRNQAQARRGAGKEPFQWLDTPVACGVCLTLFLRTEETGPNKRYCSPECRVVAMKRASKKFHEDNPDAEGRHRKNRKPYKKDNLTQRVYRKYPHLPRCCEACGESRVTELAHKPKYKRNGRYQTLGTTEDFMIWVLCPTCHKLLDRGICTPEELGIAGIRESETS